MNCGIDPGRSKIGFALADNEKLLFSAVIPKSDVLAMCRALNDGVWHLLEEWCKEGSLSMLAGKHLEKIFLGNGTSSNDIKKLLDSSLNVEIVDEYGTTLKGRKLYWELHPPTGLWKLVPLSLRTPPRKIDDLAAWAIIRQL